MVEGLCRSALALCHSELTPQQQEFELLSLLQAALEQTLGAARHAVQQHYEEHARPTPADDSEGASGVQPAGSATDGGATDGGVTDAALADAALEQAPQAYTPSGTAPEAAAESAIGDRNTTSELVTPKMETETEPQLS